MTIATYRGNRYNTETPKQEYIDWLEYVRNRAGGTLIYRGHDYLPHPAPSGVSKPLQGR